MPHKYSKIKFNYSTSSYVLSPNNFTTCPIISLFVCPPRNSDFVSFFSPPNFSIYWFSCTTNAHFQIKYLAMDGIRRGALLGLFSGKKLSMNLSLYKKKRRGFCHWTKSSWFLDGIGIGRRSSNTSLNRF